MKKIHLLFFASLAFLIGCVEFEQRIKVNPDLSGNIAIRIKYDLKTILKTAIIIQAGPDATPETYEKLEKIIRAEMEKEKSKPLPPQEELKEELPEGITLERMATKETEDQFVVYFRFAFKHINQLDDLKKFLAKKQLIPPTSIDEVTGESSVASEDQDPKQKKLDKSFFDSLNVTSKNGIKISQMPEITNMPKGIKSVDSRLYEQAPEAVRVAQLIQLVLKNFQLIYRIQLPEEEFFLLEDNAHQKQTSKNNTITLTWKYNIRSQERPEKMFVHFQPLDVEENIAEEKTVEK